MSDIVKPMSIPELHLRPDIGGKTRLSDDMQQTLATLVAYGDNARKLLKASESGVLSVSSARIKDIVHFDRIDPLNPKKGGDVACTECLCMAHPDNTDKVWVRPYKTAEISNAWPLDKNDAVSFVIDNMNQLFMLIVANNDSLIVAYTR